MPADPTHPEATGTNLTFARTLVDEWVRSGVTDAVVAPGSRSTPLAVALAERLTTHVVLDERAASFTALGLGLATGRPAVCACTSGTAATHFHAAVVEASQAAVPLVVATADRPPELHDTGAPQTTDQTRLFGPSVRWFAEPGPPDPGAASMWRPLASRAVIEATGPTPGPVHLNLAFREPLLGGADVPVPPGREDGGPWHRRGDQLPVAEPTADLAARCGASTRPLVIAGHGAADTLTLDGVPVLGDHRGPLTGTVAHWDLLLRDDAFVAAHRPDLVVRVGMPPASKYLERFIVDLDAPVVTMPPAGLRIDPSRRSTWWLDTPTALHLTGEVGWASSWHDAGVVAGTALDAAIAGSIEVTEPGVARAVLATRPTGGTLVVSSSMPIRDLESFATPRPDVRVLANRGVNGIDGVVSTALGVALSGTPTTLLIGDLALLHDQGALTGLADRPVDLTLVVVDNRGGGIFSFLPQQTQLDPDRFEQLFGTPQPVDPVALLEVHGVPTTVVTTASDLTASLADAAAVSGVHAVVVRSDRPGNVAVHDRLVRAVADALATARRP